MFFSFLGRGQKIVLVLFFFVSSILSLPGIVSFVYAAECSCDIGGPATSRDEPTRDGCVRYCGSSGVARYGTAVPDITAAGGSCLCSDGSDPGISGADLENCCRACSGRGGTGPAQGVSFNGASQSCPGSSASPQPTAAAGTYGLIDPLGGKTIPVILGGIVRAALGFVGAVFLMFFIWGGAVWMTAGGDSEKVKKAVGSIRNAVFGIVIVLLFYVLISTLMSLSSSVQSTGSGTKKATTNQSR